MVGRFNEMLYTKAVFLSIDREMHIFAQPASAFDVFLDLGDTTVLLVTADDALYRFPSGICV
jgi:hypothetical protein